LAGYRDRQAELDELGVGLAALSVDPPERSRALAEQLGLRFPLLCDPRREVVEAWGRFNRKEQGGIAYPATFVLDTSRKVRFRSLDRMASRVDLGELFAFLRGGLDKAPPAEPGRSPVVPRLGDWGRIVKNIVRHGVRSPKP
jgi:peroxiredoxin